MTSRKVLSISSRLALVLAQVLASMAVAQPAPAGADLPHADLPVTRVVLFTNGVGYFEHSGTVTGDQQLELHVDAEHMDDLLQSLVLQDFGGGSIAPVRYDSRDPLNRILGSYSLDLTGNPTLASILTQARGERVRLQASQLLEGVIVSVERVDVPEEATRHFITLATGDGLERVALDEVSDVRFESAELREELDAALGAIARYRVIGSKNVRLVFTGQGQREVRVGYVREMPVWKSSYRLVVADGTADLQGWAILDNPTDLDLVDVSVSFVAGQPISFITSLYDPIYVARARVARQASASAVPDIDSEVLGAARAMPAPAVAQMESADFMSEALAAAPPSLSGAGVEAQATGARSGATFAYHVSQPVTVGRHESVMIPIVQQTLPAERVAHFDREFAGSYPFAGVRLVNDTGLHLAAGTVSVFDETGFAGNARLSDVLPDDSRVLAYAVDLELPVDVQTSPRPENVFAAVIRGGMLEASVRNRIEITVRVDPRTEEPRLLLVDLPRRPGYDVVGLEPAPLLTADSLRFGVTLNGAEPQAAGDAVPVQLECAAGAEDPCELVVVLEQVVTRRASLANHDRGTLAFYLENVELSSEDRATIESIVDLQARIEQLTSASRSLESRIAEIHSDQNRIRSNMGALDRNSSLYRRYVTDLEAQEDQLDDLGNELETLRSEIAELNLELAELFSGLLQEGR